MSLGKKLAGQQTRHLGTCGAGAGRGCGRRRAVPGEEAEAPPVQQPQELGPLARVPSGCFSSQPRRWPPGRTEGQAAGGRLCLLGVAAWQNSYWRGCTVSGSGRAEGWVLSEKRPPERLLFPKAVFALRERGAWAPWRIPAHSDFCLSVLRRPDGCAWWAGRKGPGRDGGQSLRGSASAEC